MSLFPISVLSQSTGWEIGLSDPTVMAWLLVVSYLLIAVVCGRRGQRVPVGQRTTKMIWYVLAGSLFFLAINKQLDLHTLGFEGASNFARAQGWYEQRWIVAGWTFASMAILAVLGGGWLIHLLRSRSGSLCVAIVAATILFLTLVAQAISGTPLADFLQSGLFGAELDALWRIDVSEIIEFAALVAIGLAAGRSWSGLRISPGKGGGSAKLRRVGITRTTELLIPWTQRKSRLSAKCHRKTGPITDQFRGRFSPGFGWLSLPGSR